MRHRVFKDFNSHCRRKKIVSGGGGGDKEKFVEQHYFLRLQKQFQEKCGDAHAPQPPGSYGTDSAFS